MPFQDEWGSEFKTRGQSYSPDTALAVLADDIPFIMEIGCHLSPKEQQVFYIYHVRKVTSTSEIAGYLGMNQTGDVRKYLARIDAKMRKIRSNVSLIEVAFTGAEDDSSPKEGVVLSRHHLSPRQQDTSNNQSNCRASAPLCPKGGHNE